MSAARICQLCGIGIVNNFPPLAEYHDGAFCMKCLRALDGAPRVYAALVSQALENDEEAEQ